VINCVAAALPAVLPPDQENADVAVAEPVTAEEPALAAVTAEEPAAAAADERSVAEPEVV
jgi:hypothetical protein